VIPTEPVDLSFPNVDTGALRSVSNWLSSTSMDFFVDHLGFDSTVSLVDAGHAGWKGAARDAWDGAGKRGSGDLNTTATALQDAAGALSTLADDVDAARRRYDHAYSLMQQAQAAANAPDPRPGRTPPLDAGAYRQQVLQAQTDAFTAGSQAATKISAAAGLAAGVGRFAGQDPIRPPDLGQYPPDAGWFTILFGSVRGEEPDWKQFQDEVLARLGLKPNNQSFKVDITKQLGTRPESVDGGQVTEVKLVKYQDLDDQMLAQLKLAESLQEPYVLVVGPDTKVSAPLQQAVGGARYGGEIVRMNSDGSFTDLAGNSVVQSSGPGFQYPGTPPPGAGEGDGTLNHPSGIQNDEVVDPALAPEGGDPQVPELPGDPELPDIPEIIP
jgi:hypothetical protein